MAFQGRIANPSRSKRGFRGNLKPSPLNFAETQGQFASEQAARQMENGQTIFPSNDPETNYRISIRDGDPVFFFNDDRSKQNALPQVLSSLNGYNGLEHASHTTAEQEDLLKSIISDHAIVNRFMSEIIRDDITFVGLATQDVPFNTNNRQTTIAVHGVHFITALTDELCPGDRIELVVPTKEEIHNTRNEIMQTQGVVCNKATLRPRRRVPRDEATRMLEEFVLYIQNPSVYFRVFTNRNTSAVPARVAAMENKITNYLFNGVCMVRWLVKNGVLVVRANNKNKISELAEPIYNMIAWDGTKYNTKTSEASGALQEYTGSRADYLAATLAGAFGVIDPTATSATSKTIPQGRAFAVMSNGANRDKCVVAREEIIKSLVCHPRIADSHRSELGYRGENRANLVYATNNRNVKYIRMDSDIGRLVQVQHEAISLDAGAQLNMAMITDNFTAGIVTEGASRNNKATFYLS